MLVTMEPRTTSALGDAERDLVDRARRGDRGAFERLVSEHVRHVWRVVWRIVRHDADAEDVVQEVFLAAWQGLAGYRGECAFTTWLHRIAVTRALNHVGRSGERLRRASRPIDAPAASDPDGEPLLARLADGGPSPLQALEARELLRRLADCVSRLPAAWRAVVALRDGESLAYEEIARVLDVALGTVRSRLARARFALKECMEAAAP
ncbi:MAG: sigma-70 family RNA polymerase sigma factor [Acidobacteriia bacterium]|nr:sigma-70 family RNA polymerase sigma factor [Terriglobia bacterium]